MLNNTKLVSMIGILCGITACAPQFNTAAKNDNIIEMQSTKQSPPRVATPTKLDEKGVPLVSKTNDTTTKTANASLPTTWDLSGAIAARSGSKGWSASINWLQNGLNAYQIRLSGPLGSGTVLVQKQGSTIYFKDGKKSDSSTDAGALLKKNTGISLPVNSLYYWVRGIAAPGAIQGAKRDANNQLTHFQQNGYSIDYLNFTHSGNLTLPSQIRLQGNGVMIKLVIKRWKI